MVYIFAALPLQSFGYRGYATPKSIFGPDPYGYVAITSDDTSSLRPTWQWVDKSSDPSAAYLTMSDDDIQGPFPIGFTFPYYWYNVSQFYVHSNGVIGFSSGGFWTPHDNYIPNAAPPNNIIAGLGADLNPECGGRIYYWTNNVDSLVVTFDSVPTWHQTLGCSGAHTFQIIITADGNITVNYGPQVGGYDYGIGSTAISVGMESVLGNPGLGIYEDGMPSTANPRDSFAIKIYRPDSTTFRISDAAAHSIFENETRNVLNSGIFIAHNRERAFVPEVKVANIGTDTLYNTWAKLYIRRRFNATVVYRDSVLIPVIPPSQTVSYNLSPIDFGTFSRDFYTAHLTVSNPSDLNTSNNTQYVEIRLYHWTNPDTLYWFNWNILSTGNILFTRWLGGGGGWAQRFDPRHYPFRIDSAWLVVEGCQSTSPGCSAPINTPMFIATDTNGTVGNWMYAETLSVSRDSAKIYTIAPSSPIIVNKPFFIGYIQVDSLGPSVGIDTSKPASRQTFESTNGITWAPYRENETSDFVFVVWGRSLENTGINEKLRAKGLEFILSGDGRIYLASPRRIEIYTASGRKVFDGTVDVVDLSRYPKSVYFVKVGKKFIRVVKK